MKTLIVHRAPSWSVHSIAQTVPVSTSFVRIKLVSVPFQVMRLAGWRRVWEPRWLVISPRRHSPSASVHGSWVVLCWFNGRTDYSVCGKAWLNGAEAHVAEGNESKTLTITLQRYKPSRAQSLSRSLCVVCSGQRVQLF